MAQPSGQCHLLGGAFASSIQVCLAMLCISTLAFKRYGEIPQRPWVVWALDVGKQSVGSSFGHFSNIFLSEIIATKLTGGDECQWYCLSFLLDSTLGTFVNLSLLHFAENFIRNRTSLHYLQFGDYGDPPSLIRWTAQLGIWLTLVIIGKIVCVLILVKFSGTLEMLISYVFQDLRSHPQAELIVVMIIIPGISNVISFWITDTYLKRDEHFHEQVPQTDLDADLLEMSLGNNERSANTMRNQGASLHSMNQTSGKNDFISKKYLGNSASLFSVSATETSPSTPQTLWHSATIKIPVIFDSISSRITGTTRGLRSKTSESNLASLDKESSDENL